MLKTCGYLVSAISVLLLGIVAWQSASTKPLMLACLILGMLTSISGMFLRWLQFRAEQKQKHGAVAQLAGAARPARAGGGGVPEPARHPAPASARRS